MHSIALEGTRAQIESLQNHDTQVLHRTCKHFTTQVRVKPQETEETYNPLCQLLIQMLSSLDLVKQTLCLSITGPILTFPLMDIPNIPSPHLMYASGIKMPNTVSRAKMSEEEREMVNLDMFATNTQFRKQLGRQKNPEHPLLSSCQFPDI